MDNKSNIGYELSSTPYKTDDIIDETNPVREKNANYATLDYCNTDCEYYTNCYANFDMCLKKTFEEILSSLTEREENVLKLSFGFTESTKSLEEISELYDVTDERIRQIQAKALRKMRHPSRSKKIKPYLFDVFSMPYDTFYKRLILAIFGFEESDLLEFKLGIDFDIVDKEKNAQKSPALIQKELNSRIDEITVLQPYVRYVSHPEVPTLKQLLRFTSNQLSLATFEWDDIAFFGFVETINSLGYCFKFLKPIEIAQEELSKKLKGLIVESEIYSEQILDLSLSTTLKLLELKVFSVEDLVNKISALKITHRLPDDMQIEIDNYLLSNNLAFTLERGAILYLSRNNLNAFSENFVVWMWQNKHSVTQLLAELEAATIVSFGVINYIYERFPESIFHIDPEIAVGTIEDLDLSVRTYNCLKRADIDTIDDLLKLTTDDFSKIPNWSARQMTELCEQLESIGLLKYSNLQIEESNKEDL